MDMAPAPDGGDKARNPSPNLLYIDEYGERTEKPESTSSTLASAVRLIKGDDSSGNRRAIFTQFQSWAEDNGLTLHKEYIEARLKRLIGEGSEHFVIKDVESGRVIKVTRPDFVGDGAVGQSSNVFDYLNGLHLSNLLFNDDIRLEGNVESLDEMVSLPQLVISQPLIKGRKATAKEIKAYFTGLGYEWRDGGWRKGDVLVADASGGNVFKGTDGNTHVIDAQVSGEPAVEDFAPAPDAATPAPTDEQTQTVLGLRDCEVAGVPSTDIGAWEKFKALMRGAWSGTDKLRRVGLAGLADRIELYESKRGEFQGKLMESVFVNEKTFPPCSSSFKVSKCSRRRTYLTSAKPSTPPSLMATARRGRCCRASKITSPPICKRPITPRFPPRQRLAKMYFSPKARWWSRARPSSARRSLARIAKFGTTRTSAKMSSLATTA